MSTQSDDPSNPANPDESESEVALAEQLREPPKYAVVIHNDDYTTMEFVIEVLKKYFQKSDSEAFQIMLSIHSKGKGVGGIYCQDIAETKAYQVMEDAKSHGFPLKCTVEVIEND